MLYPWRNLTRVSWPICSNDARISSISLMDFRSSPTSSLSLCRSSITVRSVHRRCRFAFEERSVRLCWLVIGKPGSGHGLSRDSAAWGLEGRRNPLGKKHENRARAFLLDFTRAPTIGSCRRVTTAAQPSFLIYIRTLEYKGKLLHNSCCSIRRDLVATCSSR